MFLRWLVWVTLNFPKKFVNQTHPHRTINDILPDIESLHIQQVLSTIFRALGQAPILGDANISAIGALIDGFVSQAANKINAAPSVDYSLEANPFFVAVPVLAPISSNKKKYVGIILFHISIYNMYVCVIEMSLLWKCQTMASQVTS